MSPETFMLRCLHLAKQGRGYVAPNPLVGSVIVHENKIIGEGYHEEYGQAHAEVNAIKSVKNKELLKDATIYINLEPCAHFGKTPPCADLIVEHKIPRVVIGCIDSYSEVSGKGIEKLKNNGCEVQVGVLEKEALHLNKRFFTFHNLKRPYIILKWAQSSDGFMDILRSADEKGIHWITQPETKQLVHQWRHEESGILVGANTILNDNPSLDVREITGNSPTRFVIDPSNKINASDFVIGQDGKGVQFLRSKDLTENLNTIRDQNVQSILVEGGAYTLAEFIKAGLWDEARVITGTSVIMDGLKAPTLNRDAVKTYAYGLDTVQIFFNG